MIRCKSHLHEDGRVMMAARLHEVFEPMNQASR
jgi:hypothetical protein